jgi:hypothetical protein
MAQINASKFHTFLIGQESTFGTAVVSDKDCGLVQSFSASDKRTIDEVYASGSREIQELVAAKAEFNADLEVNLQNGRLFEYIFGGVSHVLTGSDTKHTFSVTSTIPSMTIESSFNTTDDDVFIYSGTKINSGTVNLDTNGILKLTASTISKQVDTSTATASAAVISSLPVLHYKNSTLSTGTAGAETTVGKLQTFNVTMENNLNSVDAAGNYLAQELVEENFKMAFDFTMFFETLTEYEIFLGGTVAQLSPTKQSAEFNANNGVALGSGRREFNIQLNDFLYEEVGTPTTVGEKIVQSFKGSVTNLGTNSCFYVDNLTSAEFS